MIVEIAGKEEVPVLLVIRCIYFKGSELFATGAGDTLRRALFLKGHHLQFQLTKLHIRADTKEAAGALDKGRVGRERDITGLDEFDDFIFLAIVFQLHVLRIEVKGGVGVVVEVEVHLVADLTVDVEVDLLIEVHRGGLAVANWQRRVVDILECSAEFQFC